MKKQQPTRSEMKGQPVPIFTTAKIFLQLDLEGYSRWLQRSSSKPNAVSATVEFAEDVTSDMKKYEFARVYWAGDGGMFARDATGLQNYDEAIVAAEALAKVFSRWRKKNAERQTLRIRISIHAGYPVYVHEHPGYWVSEHLNAFAKNERTIAIAGAIAITNAVRESLSQKLVAQFPEASRREFRVRSTTSATALISHIYFKLLLPTHDETPTKQVGLSDWLEGIAKETGIPQTTDIGPRTAIRAILGDGVLLQTVSSPRDKFFVELKKSPRPPAYALTKSDLETLAHLESDVFDQVNARGLETSQKVSPDRVVLPLMDIPNLTIEWHEEHWSKTRAFQRMLVDNKRLHQRFAAKAADVQVQGFKYPGILCAHIVVRIDTPDRQGPFALLCQRNLGGIRDRHYQGTWSCSIEEQVRPGEDIEQCVRRAVSEELLGSGFSESVSHHVVGFVLEDSILGSALLIVVDVPLFYGEIIERWQKVAPDKDEHRQVVGIPLQHDGLVACAKYKGLRNYGGLDETVRKDCLVADRAIFDGTTDWNFHPTSLIRFASALWMESQ